MQGQGARVRLRMEMLGQAQPPRHAWPRLALNSLSRDCKCFKNLMKRMTSPNYAHSRVTRVIYHFKRSDVNVVVGDV